MDIALLHCPAWLTDCPPYAPAVLSAGLKKAGYDVVCYDLNIEFYHITEKEHHQKPTKISTRSWSEMSIIEWENHDNAKEFITAHSDTIDQYIDQILRKPVSMVGFTTYFVSSLFSYEIARRIKKRQQDIIIVFGGPLCFKNAYEFRVFEECEAVDIICFGEAEEAIIKLADCIRDNKDYTQLDGFGFRLPNGEIDQGRDMPRIEDFENLPFADFSDFDLSQYTRKLLPMNSCRGCVNRCAFCNESPYWGKYRSRSAKRIYDEISFQLDLYPKIDNIWFIDSLINGNIKVMSEMCDFFIASPRKFSWDASALIRKELTDEMLIKMKASGCNSLHYGLESGSNHVLKLMRKGYNRLLAKDVLKRTLNAGIQINVNLIVGFPGETISDFMETLDMIRQLRQFKNFTFKPPVNTCHLVKGSYVYFHYDEYHLDSNEHKDWLIKDGSNTPSIRDHRQKLLRKFIEMGGQKNFLAYTRDYFYVAYIFISLIFKQFHIQHLRFFYYKYIFYSFFNGFPPSNKDDKRWIYEKFLKEKMDKNAGESNANKALSFMKDKYASIKLKNEKVTVKRKLLSPAGKYKDSIKNLSYISKHFRKQLKKAIYTSEVIMLADRKVKYEFYLQKTGKIISMLPEEYTAFHLYTILLLKMDMKMVISDLDEYSEDYLLTAIVPMLRKFFEELS